MPVVAVDHRDVVQLLGTAAGADGEELGQRHMGSSPESVQESTPPQSPVWQLPLPSLKEHPLRPHTLPDCVPVGTLRHVHRPRLPGVQLCPPATPLSSS